MNRADRILFGALAAVLVVASIGAVLWAAFAGGGWQ